MVSRPRPLPPRLPASAFGLTLGTLLLTLALHPLAAAPLAPPVTEHIFTAINAADLAAQPDALAAEAWLLKSIPAGTALADAPDFFAAAHEVFYDPQEGLMVFVYRSATSPRWKAWVSFDPQRAGVVHSAAADQ